MTTPPLSGLEDQQFEFFDVKWIVASSAVSDFSYFGCLASKDIPKNTLIHKERYTLQGQDIWTALEMYQHGGENGTKDDDDEYLRRIGLSDIQRKQLWKLHDQRHPLNTPRLMGIIYSNGFSNSDLGREPCLFVGATSRFNHSCCPNIGMDFSGYEIRLFTSRQVLKGEELCLSYNEVIYYHSTTVRKAVLQHKYKFDCYCSACNELEGDSTMTAAATTTRAASDENRKRLGYLACRLAHHVPGAHFLYNAAFEQSIDKIKKEEESSNMVPAAEDDIDENKDALKRLLEYMSGLQEEQIDHDLLQCSELALDLSLDRRSKMWNSSRTRKGCVDDDDDVQLDPKYWAQKTVTLYKLHKGENHTSTKIFIQKLKSIHGLYDQEDSIE